jgi:hypothetical protein
LELEKYSIAAAQGSEWKGAQTTAEIWLIIHLTQD